MAIVGYATYKYILTPNTSIFTEKSFYEEALTLTRGYKPITEKLVEPVKPLTIDTSDKFNVLTLLGAQVSPNRFVYYSFYFVLLRLFSYTYYIQLGTSPVYSRLYLSFNF